MKALEDEGFGIKGSGAKYEIDEIVGSSAGSLFGAFITNGFSDETIARFLEEKSFLRYFVNPKPREKGKMYGLSYFDVFPPNIPDMDEVVHTLKRFTDLGRFKALMNDANEYARAFIPMFMRTGDLEGSLEKVLEDYSDIEYYGIENFLREFISIPAISNTDRIEKYLEQILEINDFNQLRREKGIDFYVVASELDRPRKAIFGHKKTPYTSDPWADRWIDSVPISTACAASCTLPVIYRPKKIIIEGEKTYFVDGEVKKTLSTHVPRQNGADLIIISHTLEPYRYQENKGSLVKHGLVSILIQTTYIMVAQKIRSAWANYSIRRQVYEYLSDQQFQDDLEKIVKDLGDVDKEKFKKTLTDFLEEKVCDMLQLDLNLQYIYLPSSSDIFWMDHFNIFPHYMRKLVNSGYNRAKEILDKNYTLIK